ncbi:hypothetical protein [Curtobacterium oceanosedimentum]|uniref:Uncharacterized protein n=1 Tax=Curtobacterium oceanosedimentum TaxID=465820 RepID=A0A147DTH7_9MICO|nr:hypothetical protein [Curtobacterium oceanosedimentum]KTR53219.1 hypothetical protein NS359_03940 [Curtobacterium oceanosedimentum]
MSKQFSTADTGAGRPWLLWALTVPFAVVLAVMASLVAMGLDEARSFGWLGSTDSDLDVAQMNRDEALGGAMMFGGAAVLLVLTFVVVLSAHAWRRDRPFRYWFWPMALVLIAVIIPFALIR